MLKDNKKGGISPPLLFMPFYGLLIFVFVDLLAFQ